MHDTVAHSIGIVALQAGAARRVIDTHPEQVREALGEVETASRETLAGMRRMLGSLRQSEQRSGAAASSERSPAPGLLDVERLAAMTTAAGVKVEVRRTGEPRPLPPEIDLSAFRIIQESVANVVRHAGTDFCQVSIDYREHELSLEIVDSGRGGTTSDSGYGLIGLRERVGLLNGQFSAKSRPEGGFAVTARLPLPAAVR